MLIGGLSVHAQEPTLTLSIKPQSIYLTSEQSSNSAVTVTQANNLMAIDVALRFDPTVATVVDADPNRAGTQVALGEMLSNKNFFTAVNLVEDGVIRFSGTLIAPETALSGEGVLLDIEWQGSQAGKSALTFEQIILVDEANQPLNVQTEAGQLFYGTAVTLVGQARRQGQQDHADITIQLGETTTTTDAEGYFNLQGFSPYQLTFNAPHYLSLSLAGEATSAELNQVDVGSVQLLAGDLNDDDKVDIFDISILGSHYDSADTLHDLTGDGQVDIFDMALAGANYGQSGPTLP